jgi:hypothetical protein
MTPLVLYFGEPLDPGFPGNFPAPFPPNAAIAAVRPPVTSTAAKPVRPRENRRSRIVDTSDLLTAIRSPFHVISLPSCWRTRVIDNTTDAPVSLEIRPSNISAAGPTSRAISAEPASFNVSATCAPTPGAGAAGG